MSTSPTPEVNAYAPPQADTTIAPVLPSIKAEVPTNVKIAGWLMIANAAIILIARMILPMSTGVIGIAPAVIDLVIGASLARGNGQLRIWAMIRCVGGAVLVGGLLVSQGNYIDAGITLAACASLFFLLMGRAGTARIAICTSLFGLYLLVQLIVVIMASAGSSLLR